MATSAVVGSVCVCVCWKKTPLSFYYVYIGSSSNAKGNDHLNWMTIFFLDGQKKRNCLDCSMPWVGGGGPPLWSSMGFLYSPPIHEREVCSTYHLSSWTSKWSTSRSSHPPVHVWLQIGAILKAVGDAQVCGDDAVTLGVTGCSH